MRYSMKFSFRHTCLGDLDVAGLEAEQRAAVRRLRGVQARALVRGQPRVVDLRAGEGGVGWGGGPRAAALSFYRAPRQ